LFELFLDRSVRRSSDFAKKLKLELFLSVPDLSAKQPGRLLFWRRKHQLPEPSVPSESEGALLEGNNLKPDAIQLVKPNAIQLVMPVAEQLLHPFHETLRDRIIASFERRNLTHKPKLIALAGLGAGAGVTTTAAGLAKTLSETGGGNVLFVDLSPRQAAAHQFYRGKTVCGLDELLLTRGNAQVEENLYVVSDSKSGERLSKVLPSRFRQLVPKLKASDFDYIIFDMPPVSELSVTPRLAGFMDMMLLVVESGKTSQELVQRAMVLLADAKVHVGGVLNKAQTYGPRKLALDPAGLN
jgi:Mrp family chromosome partitioning ATPase